MYISTLGSKYTTLIYPWIYNKVDVYPTQLVKVNKRYIIYICISLFCNACEYDGFVQIMVIIYIYIYVSNNYLGKYSYYQHFFDMTFHQYEKNKNKIRKDCGNVLIFFWKKSSKLGGNLKK